MRSIVVLAAGLAALAAPLPAGAEALVTASPASGPAVVAVVGGRLAWRAALPDRPVGTAMIGPRVLVSLPNGLAAVVNRERLWHLPLATRPTAPTVHWNLVIVGTAGGQVIAVDPETGRVAWRTDVGGPVSAAPTPSGDLVVVGTRQREVLALAANGTIRWRTPTSGRVTARTAAVPGMVYVASLDGRLTALDAVTGEPRWTAPLGGTVEEGLIARRDAAGRDLVVALRDDGTLAALLIAHPRRGEPRVAWTYRQGADAPAPAVAGGRLLLGGRDLVALDAMNGGVVWRLSETLSRSFSRDIVRRLVDREQGLSPEEVRAARATSAYELRGAIVRSPLVDGGLVLAATDEGFLYAVDPATGELLWRVAEGD